MLIDNKKSSKLGEVLIDNIQNNCKLSIISSYFTLYGFFYLKKALEKVQSTRLIINSKQFKDDLNLLLSTKSEIKLKNNFQQAKIAKECYEWLRQKAQIKDIRIENSIPFNLYHLTFAR